MKHASKLLSVVSVAALSLLGANAAQAAGTVAGATITNTVAVNYTVGGIAQNAASASNTVTVDRRVTFTLTSAPATTTVSPGQNVAVTAYTLTNVSNDTLDFPLSHVNQAIGAAAVHGGNTAFTTGTSSYFIDSNSNGTYDAGTDQAVTWVDEVAPDTSRTIFVVTSIPLSATNTQIAGVVLTATAAAGGSAAAQGTVLTNSTGANTAGIDTVFADAAGTSDGVNDGRFSTRGDYTVFAPVLTVQKLSTIISDPINNTTNPKAIPGAVVEYCIVVQNGAGGAPVNNLSISDPLPAQTTYLSSFGILLNGTYNGTSCNADGAANAANSSYTAPAGSNPANVSGTLNNVNGGGATTMRFRVTIN